MCDLHGHSRKKGIFIYGCEKGTKDMTPTYPGWPVPGSHGGLPTASVRSALNSGLRGEVAIGLRGGIRAGAIPHPC